MAIEKRTSKGAIILSYQDEWSLRLEPGDDVVLGRSPETAGPLPHVSLARHHARVSWSGADCTIEDLGSSSGTYVNEKLVRDPTVLTDGDVIRIGALDVKVSKG